MAEPGSGWEDVCWICLATSTEGPSTPLVYPCACPRPVHETCLAKWQLHCAGREEESCCRFCKHPLPHWRQAFRARTTSSSSDPVVSPLMSIQFHGQTYWLQVQTGEGGVQQFQADVKRLLDLSSEDDFDITFECQVPGEGGKLELHGLQAFDAAVYCASLTAAERMQTTGGSTDDHAAEEPGSSTAAGAAEAADAPPGTPQLSQQTAELRSARDWRRSSSGSDSLLGDGASSSRSSSRGRASSSSGNSSRAGSDSGSSTCGLQPSMADATLHSMQPGGSSRGGFGSELDRQQQQKQQGSRLHDGAAAADSSAGGVLVTSEEGMVRMGVQGLWEVASRAWSWLSSKSNMH